MPPRSIVTMVPLCSSKLNDSFFYAGFWYATTDWDNLDRDFLGSLYSTYLFLKSCSAQEVDGLSFG